MFPTDPRQMQQLLRQMGIKSKMVDAKRVVIECEGSNIIITNPKVMEMNVKGELNYNISGDVSEEASVNEEDIALIMEKTGATREKALQALKENGDVASAIVALSDAEA